MKLAEHMSRSSSVNPYWSKRRIRRAAALVYGKYTYWAGGILYFRDGTRVEDAPEVHKPMPHVRIEPNSFVHRPSQTIAVQAATRADAADEVTPVEKPRAKKLSLPGERTPPLKFTPSRGAGGQFTSRR